MLLARGDQYSVKGFRIDCCCKNRSKVRLSFSKARRKEMRIFIVKVSIDSSASSA